jgi:hypothetical protein
MRSRTGRRIEAGWRVAALCALALAAVPVIASAHGFSAAGAKKPAYDISSLELVGSGGFATENKHAQIRVTVCLRKRSEGRFLAVRCEMATDSDRRVRAGVSVPGCVDGVWRTTTLGEAINRRGVVAHSVSKVSARFVC